ncbi:MAG: hypothetical protein RR752_00480, partial [Mucinivorans sp.]
KGVIYGINLHNTRMDMFWHSDNSKKDSMTFWFDLPTSVVPDYAQQDISFVVARHDYSYADPARGGVDLPSIGNLKVPRHRRAGRTSGDGYGLYRKTQKRCSGQRLSKYWYPSSGGSLVCTRKKCILL